MGLRIKIAKCRIKAGFDPANNIVSHQTSISMKISLVILFLLSEMALANSFRFDVTKEFCDLHFNSAIAFAGEPYNATDVVDDELPPRRMVGEFVTSNIAYIWYEHGGRGYHQHLIRYNVLKPQEILENYIFYKSQYRDIREVIKNKTALYLAPEGEL